MNTPGSILKTEREKQNRSLKDISTDLKIKTEYLRALEEDNYEVLPAEIYTKSYLRLYADTLHINNDHLLDLYKNLTKPVEHEGDDASAKKKNDLDFNPSSLIIPDKEHRSFRKYFNLKTGLIVASLVLIIAIITTRDEKKAVVMTGTDDDKVAVTAGSDKQKTAPAVVSDQKKAAAASDSDKQKITVSDQKAAVTPGSDKQKTAPAVVSDQKKAAAASDSDNKKITVSDQKAAVTPGSDKQKAAAANINKVAETTASESKTIGKLSLKVLATETTWISARIDGAPRREWSIRKDMTLTLEANEKFVIKVGNAGGTKLFLNGKDLGVLGPPGKVTDIVIP